MKLTCTLTGAQVETQTDEAAKRLIASGGFVQTAPAKPAKRARKAPVKKTESE